MIVKNFYISDLDLKYFVGINQINIDIKKILELNKLKSENEALDFIFNLVEKVQIDYDSMVQFYSDSYILNQDHISTACFYVQKAFFNNVNISKKKNIEFLLYLATKRQIKNAIEAFGIKISDLKYGNLNYCIISNKNNLKRINEEILYNLKANEKEITLNSKNVKKFKKIKNFFEISDNQINAVLNSYEVKEFNGNDIANNLINLFLALYDLICEKMALLSLENIKLE